MIVNNDSLIAPAFCAIIRIDRQGKYEIVATHFEGKRSSSPNDVVIGPDSAIYFTDPTVDLAGGQKQELAFQGVYHLDPLGTVTLLTGVRPLGASGAQGSLGAKVWMWMQRIELGPQPYVSSFAHKFIVIQFRISAIYPINLLLLSRTESLLRI